MRARIYQPARNAMTSGQARTKRWVLDFAPDAAREIDPLMGWTSSGDTQAQANLRLATKQEALASANKPGLGASVSAATRSRPWMRATGYGENFATARRTTWTH